MLWDEQILSIERPSSRSLILSTPGGARCAWLSAAPPGYMRRGHEGLAAVVAQAIEGNSAVAVLVGASSPRKPDLGKTCRAGFENGHRMGGAKLGPRRTRWPGGQCQSAYGPSSMRFTSHGPDDDVGADSKTPRSSARLSLCHPTRRSPQSLTGRSLPELLDRPRRHAATAPTSYYV
jgi:hypothetical protein